MSVALNRLFNGLTGEVFIMFKKNRFDKEAQQSGKWFEYDGGEFLLASAKSKLFIDAYASKVNEEGNLESDEDLHEVLLSVILDWKNVVDEDGETPLEFNKEDLLEILQGDDEFARWALAKIINQDNYRREAVAKKAKK